MVVLKCSGSCSRQRVGVAILKPEIQDQASSGLRPCAVFELPEAAYPVLPPGKQPPFRDPAGLLILRKIAEGLSNRGYRTTKVKPAIGIEAGVLCRPIDGSRVRNIFCFLIHKKG